MKEIVETHQKPLLKPDILLYDKEHFENNLVAHFLFREIAFDTPEQFIWKLNAYVNERAQSYNKMFTSQLIEIDPFVTDYIVQTDSGKQKTKETKNDNQSQYNKRNLTYTSDTSSDGNENYEDEGSNKHYRENAGTALSARLNSESENTNRREDNKTTLEHDENTSDTTTTKTTSDTDIDRTTNKDYTHEQTGRQWTENGNSSGHKLNVHSDTPQAMLFNTPPHYTGTGRMDLEGKTETPSTEYPQHYNESSPSSIDSADLGFNGGDSPWFNYATNADNNIAHDAYNKSGTETFSQSDNTSENSNETQNSTENQTKTSKGTRDFTENGSTETNGSDSRSLNSNEHTKGDTKEQENYTEQGNTKYDVKTSNTGKRVDNSETTNDTANIRKQHNDNEKLTNNESVRKGRMMRSPSQLLAEYRATMTFNADLWMYNELEPLFMQLF